MTCNCVGLGTATRFDSLTFWLSFILFAGPLDSNLFSSQFSRPSRHGSGRSRHQEDRDYPRRGCPPIDVEQVSRFIRDCIGPCNIAIHAIVTNTCDVTDMRRWGMDRECEVIVHINRMDRAKVTHVSPKAEPPPKRAKGTSTKYQGYFNDGVDVADP